MKGLKFDEEKLPYYLLPMDVIDDVVEVQKYGFKKYGKANSWKLVQNGKQRYISAAMRHISKFQQGKRYDESSLHHLSHAICSLIYALWIDKKYAKRHKR
jgi:hypothetical protein